MKKRTMVLVSSALLLASLLLSIPAWSQQVLDLRYRSGLESLLKNQQMVIRVTELERTAPGKRLVVVFFDKEGRALFREFGRVSAARPYEVILPADAIGLGERELVRVDVRVLGVEDSNAHVVNVDVYDPLELVWGEGWSCNGPNASGRGPIGNCKGIVDLIPRP